jgi:hypothetical protein
VDEAPREYDGRTAWSATSWDGLSGYAENCADADGDGAADAILSGRDPWSCDSPFGSSDVGNRILRQRMCEIEGRNSQNEHRTHLTLVYYLWG